MKTRLLITGSNEQLGNELRALARLYPDIDMKFTDVGDLDITDQSAVDAFIANQSFDGIINCAAYTAVDKAETEKELAFGVNAMAPANLARACKKSNIGFVHVSTDYVFNGQSHKPYTEDDVVHPLGVYGMTKWQGEEEIRKIGARGVIIRTSWLYSAFGHNFLKTILRLAAERESLGIVFDQVGTPTYAADLAAVMLDKLSVLLNADTVKTYHYANEGVASWYDFAHAIVELEGLKCLVKPILSVEFPTPASRPHYSVLNKARIKSDLGISIPYWQDSLKRCLQEIHRMNNDQKI